MIRQGDVWWASFLDAEVSEAGLRRPVVVVQGDGFNRSRITTVVCVPLTSQIRWADAPGNVLLSARSTGLPRDSVANVSLIVAIDRASLTERVGAITERELQQVFNGIDMVLGKA